MIIYACFKCMFQLFSDVCFKCFISMLQKYIRMLHMSGWALFHRKPQTEPNQPEPKSRFYRFFGSVSVLESKKFGVRLHFRFLLSENRTTDSNRSHLALQTTNWPAGHNCTGSKGSPPRPNDQRPQPPEPRLQQTYSPIPPIPPDAAIPNPNLHLPISARPRRNASGSGGVRDAGTQLVGARRAARCGGASKSTAAQGGVERPFVSP